METRKELPVAIIGAGPVGLAAAAHLIANNQPFIIFEAGKTVAANILSWQHVQVFSPWKYNMDKAAKQLLEEAGWESPDEDALPTGKQLYEQYFLPFSKLEVVNPYLHLESKVISVGRKNLDKVKTKGRENIPFVIQVLHQETDIQHYEVKAIIDASGTWNSQNPIGSGGIYAVGELENTEKIFYGIPDINNEHKNRYKSKKVVVIGGGHSAINTILELNKLKLRHPDTEIHWVLRKNHINEVFGGQENDALPARGALGIKIENLIKNKRLSVYTPFQVQQIEQVEGQLMLIGYQHEKKFALSGIDEIISNTGSRPDFSFLKEVRLGIDPALESVAAIAGLIDPNIHSCGTVRPHGELELQHPDKDFYIVGSKSYGRAPTFLMATGYEQVRSIVAAISGDIASARKVELDLPETGVCSTNFKEDAGEEETSACCGPVAAKEALPVSACCG